MRLSSKKFKAHRLCNFSSEVRDAVKLSIK